MRKSLQLVVRVVYPPTPQPTRSSILWQRWPSLLLGTGLAISESLPFMDHSYNGIFHALKQIKQELDR